MSEYIFVTNIFEYLNIRIYSSHSALKLKLHLLFGLWCLQKSWELSYSFFESLSETTLQVIWPLARVIAIM